jgi:hypothetical protein
MRDLAFSLGLGSPFTHELDAVPNHEWRGLPLLETLPDDGFSPRLSRLLIFGGSILGALHLVLSFKREASQPWHLRIRA